MIDREYFFKKLEISNLRNFYHCFIMQYSKNINKIFKRHIDELFLAINDNLFNLNIIHQCVSFVNYNNKNKYSRLKFYHHYFYIPQELVYLLDKLISEKLKIFSSLKRIFSNYKLLFKLIPAIKAIFSIEIIKLEILSIYNNFDNYSNHNNY